MKAIAQSVRAQNRTAHHSAISFLEETVENKPALVVQALLGTPELATGIRNFDYLVDQLLKHGFRDGLMKLAEAPSLRSRERSVLVNRLQVA